jgi:sulfate adenylyltransferase
MTVAEAAVSSEPDATTPVVPGAGIPVVDRLLPGHEVEAMRRSLETAPGIRLDARQVSDVHCLAIGAFSPLRGFMGSADHAGVVGDMRLRSGAVWALPVVLAVDPDVARSATPGHAVRLDDPDGEPLAVLEVDEVFEVDVAAEVEQCFGTGDPQHPGVAARLAQGAHCVAGEVWALRVPGSSFPDHDLTPVQTRALFAQRGWRTVVGFQTRNPVHRAHEYLQKVALETIDGLFLQPLVGETKGDDVPAAVRMRCYTTLLEGYYPKDRVVLGTFPAAMRYAGPREAVFHATVRRNYGCTHFIVGRDHAGVGSYYGTYDAQLIFDRVDPVGLGITPLRFEHTFWCHACEGMASTRTCPHGSEHHLILSGTKVRAMLAAGELPPPEFSRPEVAQILIEAYAAAG